MMNKLLFLDKDGTLIENVPYNTDPGRIKLCAGVPEALRLLRQHGFKLVVVTNQAGVAHGYFKEEALTGVRQALEHLLLKHGVTLDDFYYCPHHAGGTVSRYAMQCTCRKPMPGMLIQGAVRHQADLASSWMIGDILNDVEAGNRAGCRTILIDNGNETCWDCSSAKRVPTFIAKNMLEAASLITGSSLLSAENGEFHERPMQKYY